MASDAAQLVVRLEAKLDQFERALKQAGSAADREAREIESRFSNLNPSMTWATTVGDLLGRGISAGVGLAIEAITDFIERLKALPDLAKRTGESVRDLFALQTVLGKDGGLEPEQVNKGLEALGTRLNDARREANELSKLFEANGQKIKDVAGNAIPLQEALGIVANLVQNASSEFDKIKIAEIAGLSKEWVKSLEGGSQALATARDAAASTQPDLQAMIDKAKEFDTAWREVAQNLGLYLKSAAVEFGAALADAAKKFPSEFAKPHDITALIRGADQANGDSMKSVIQDMARKAGPAGPPSDAPVPPVRPKVGSSTVIPTKSKGGGGGGESLDSFEREERRANEYAARLEMETATIGLNTEARTKNLESLRLRQMLEREGIPLTDEYVKRIDEVSTKLAKATAAQDAARQAQRQTLELQNFAGQELLSVLDQMMERGAKAADVMRNLAATIAKALAQAAILGTGPFAGLLGTASSNPANSMGGLIGLAFSALPKFAAGTDYAPGGLALVGERGPELVNLPRGSQVVPNHLLAMPKVPDVAPRSSVASINMSTTIDARGSTMSEGQIAALLDRRDRALAARIAPLVRDAASRGRLR